MLLHEYHDKLMKFGVINVVSLEQAAKIDSQSGGDMDTQLELEMRNLGKPRIGKYGGVSNKSVLVRDTMGSLLAWRVPRTLIVCTSWS